MALSKQAMFDYAALHKRTGETDAAAFARLTEEGDETIAQLWAASDVAQTAELHKNVLAKNASSGGCVDLVKSAENLIDRYLEMRKRADETTEQAHARLATSDLEYERLYTHSCDVRRFLRSSALSLAGAGWSLSRARRLSHWHRGNHAGCGARAEAQFGPRIH